MYIELEILHQHVCKLSEHRKPAINQLVPDHVNGISWNFYREVHDYF